MPLYIVPNYDENGVIFFLPLGLQHTELEDGAEEREPQLQRPPPLRRRRHRRHQQEQPPHLRAWYYLSPDDM